MLFGSPGVQTQGEEGSTPFGDAETVEEYVREYWHDIPIMAEVARCESHFRHFDKNGDIIRGEVNKKDVGVMQINEYYHRDTAKKMDMDLYTLEGNLEYARYLYEKEGTAPWSASRSCWNEQHLAMNQ